MKSDGTAKLLLIGLADRHQKLSAAVMRGTAAAAAIICSCFWPTVYYREFNSQFNEHTYYICVFKVHSIAYISSETPKERTVDIVIVIFIFICIIII